MSSSAWAVQASSDPPHTKMLPCSQREWKRLIYDMSYLYFTLLGAAGLLYSYVDTLLDYQLSCTQSKLSHQPPTPSTPSAPLPHRYTGCEGYCRPFFKMVSCVNRMSDHNKIFTVYPLLHLLLSSGVRLPAGLKGPWQENQRAVIVKIIRAVWGKMENEKFKK